MGDNGFLDVSREGPVALLTIGRPEVLNALNGDMLTRLIEVLRTVSADPSVRAIVLTGAGRAFMAGADVRMMASASLSEFRRFVEDIQELTRVVRTSSVPVIAAVNGVAAASLHRQGLPKRRDGVGELKHRSRARRNCYNSN